MKPLKHVVVGVLTACCLTVSMPTIVAAVCETPDVVYLHFRNLTNTVFLSTSAVDTIAVWLTNTSVPAEQLTGFDMRLVTDAASGVLEVIGAILPAAAVNSGTPNDLSVSFPPGTLTTTSGRTALCRLAIRVTSNTCCALYLKASSVTARLSTRTQTGVSLSVTPASGSTSLPVAGINCYGSIPVCVAAASDFSVEIAIQESRALAGASVLATNEHDPGLESTTGQRIWIAHPEWPAESDRYGQDIKATYDPLQHMRQWTFTVDIGEPTQSGPFAPGPRTVSFSPSFAETDGIAMLLRDAETDTIVSLWPGLVYTRDFLVDANYSFDLLVGANSASPVPVTPSTPVTSLLAFPNPFNPHVEFALTLSQPGNVQVHVFDSRGARVRTMSLGMVQEGERRLNWDGADNHGRPVAGGLYLVAVEWNGELARVVTKVSLVR